MSDEIARLRALVEAARAPSRTEATFSDAQDALMSVAPELLAVVEAADEGDARPIVETLSALRAAIREHVPEGGEE